MSSVTAASKPSAVGGFTEAALESFLQNREEPAWLSDRRRAAHESFRASAWPTLRDEEWRRTDIRPLKLAAFAPASGAEPTVEARGAVGAVLEALQRHNLTGLEHVDAGTGHRPDSSKLPPGVVFAPLAEAARTHPELIKKYLLTQAVHPDEDVFTALHAAFWTCGAFLYVPRGVQIDAPLFHLVGMSAAGSVDLNHTLVILEEGASATLVQETASRGRENAPALHVGAVELFVGPRAKLRFVNIQNWDLGTWHFSRERAIVERDGAIQWTVGGLGSRLAKVNQDVTLAGEGSRAQVNGVIFTTGRQNLTYLTRQDHVAPHTTSDLLYKCGLKDNSRTVWKGMIRVEKDAQRTDAYQKNDNLLLADTARADSIPGLEIEANDVRCTHGATAGRVDDEMVFYLRSRGIARDEAVRLIVEGFFAKVYDRITLEPVQETLRQAVADKLNQ